MLSVFNVVLSVFNVVFSGNKQVIIRKCVIMPELKESPLSQITVAGVILLKRRFDTLSAPRLVGISYAMRALD